jgi:hypothetical protein
MISTEQTTKWVAGNISQMSTVRDVVVTGPSTIQITSKKNHTFVAGIVSATTVTAEIVQSLLDADSEIDFVANVPKESLWTGDAIKAATSRHVAFGGIGDLMSAISRGTGNVREYIRK